MAKVELKQPIVDEISGAIKDAASVARCRDLVVLKVKELVGRHVVGQDIAAVGLEHRWEHDAVEHDVVLSDEMYEAR